MVLRAVFDFGIWLFELIAEFIPSSQPMLYNVANTFWDIASFGVWVIGPEMWAIFTATIAGWLTAKLVVGLVLFVYRLIPFI